MGPPLNHRRDPDPAQGNELKIRSRAKAHQSLKTIRLQLHYAANRMPGCHVTTACDGFGEV